MLLNNKYVMMPLAIIAFAVPLLLHAYKGAKNRASLSSALQLAAAVPFAGVTAYQIRRR